MWEEKGREALGGPWVHLGNLSSGGQLLSPGTVSVMYQFAHGQGHLLVYLLAN